MSEVTDLIKANTNILGMLYTDLAHPSVKAIGDALGTVFEFSTSILLGLKLHNEKTKLNFKKRLDEYKEKLEQIPEEKRCEVHPQIGTPILDKLTYTTNDTIADLFTTLLANASNMDMSHTAHPAFISMIDRMSPDEALIIKSLQKKDFIPYCDIRAKIEGGGFSTLLEHSTLIGTDIKLFFPENVSAYLANLVVLGILKDMDDLYKTDSAIYEPILEACGFESMKKNLVPNPFKDITAKKGFYQITEFGNLFINACVKERHTNEIELKICKVNIRKNIKPTH